MWKVSKENIQIFPHPNADSLELGRVGDFQVVVPKGKYSEGEEVVFVPKRSILTGAIREEFETYLSGPKKDRVGQVRLRGELSEGIIVPWEFLGDAIRNAPVGADLSGVMGIEQYFPPLPASFGGPNSLYPADVLTAKHDVYQRRLYEKEFDPEEEVVITEKVHGSHVVITFASEGRMFVSSKGLHSREVHLLEDKDNVYWQAIRNSGLLDAVKTVSMDPDLSTQIFGEVVPVQGGNWTYGHSKPHLLIFDYRVNGKRVPIPVELSGFKVPELFRGLFKDVDLDVLCQGPERVSGRSLHIREGVVVSPASMRQAKDGRQLFMKVINPEYAKKESGDEIS